MLLHLRFIPVVAILLLLSAKFALADQQQVDGQGEAVNPHQLGGAASGSFQAAPPSYACERCAFYLRRAGEVVQDIQEVRREIENYRKWIEKLWQEYNECVRTKPPETCSNIMHDIRSLEDRLAFLLERLSQLEKEWSEIPTFIDWWCGQCTHGL